MKRHTPRYAHLLLRICIMSLIFLATALTARAEGSFFLFPESGVYNVGETFEIEVRVDTGGDEINAAEGRIEFNQAELNIVSITTNDSIFSSWFPAPEFSNEDGVVNFGGSNADSYTGTNGNVLTIEFEALANTESEVNFQSGAAILAANGLGTNILSTLSSGVYTMTSKEVVPVIEYVSARNTPTVTKLTSPTHPTEEGWFATSTAVFRWTLPDDATAVRMLADDSPETIPTLYHPEPMIERDIVNLDDGTWYFHIQAQNDFGWGPVEHRQFNIDSEKPGSLEIIELERSDLTDPGVSFFVTATDTLSGVSHYEIALDGGEAKEWTDDDSGSYTLSQVEPGEHTILVKAVDFAGNHLIESLEFTVDALPPPTLIEVPSELTSGTVLSVKGKAQPDADVTIYVTENDKSPIARSVHSNDEGSFSYVHDETVIDGIYKIAAQVTDKRGAKSPLSNQAAVAVQAPTLVVFGERAVSALSIIVPLTGLSVVLLLILLYGLSRVRKYRLGVTQETTEAEDVLHKTFDALREQVKDELRMLDRADKKRTLTEEEEQLRIRFKEMFDIAEEAVGKEIRDIKKVPPPTKVRLTVESLD